MKTILILDDNTAILEAATLRLPKYVEGSIVLTGPNGAQGEAILKSTPVDIIVTDLAMPVMDGFALIEYAKKHFPSIPVCVMTAHDSPVVIDRLMSLGVTAWIVKPFKFDQLARLIARQLGLVCNAVH
jgi:DNA-binding NtrC family response regulator